MKLLTILLLIPTLVLAQPSSYEPLTPQLWAQNDRPLDKEQLRFWTSADNLPVLLVRNLNIVDGYIDLTITVAPKSTSGHIAFGLGQLYEGLEQADMGLPPTEGPKGEGFIIGPGCLGKDLDSLYIQLESYYTRTIVDPTSCIKVTTETPIRVEFTNTTKDVASYKITYNGTVVTRDRSWPVARNLSYNRGFWMIPLPGSPKLVINNLQVGKLPKPSTNNESN